MNTLKNCKSLSTKTWNIFENGFFYNTKTLPFIFAWIFQKVLAEIVQKGLILLQKGLISNRRNFGLSAPKSMRFRSKYRKSKDLSFLFQKFFTSDFSLLTERAWKFVP